MNESIKSHNFRKNDGTSLTGKSAIEYYQETYQRTANLDQITGSPVTANEILVPRSK